MRLLLQRRRKRDLVRSFFVLSSEVEASGAAADRKVICL